MVSKEKQNSTAVVQNDETIDSHRIDLAVLLGERLKTDAKKGLSSKEHALRLEADGPNRISPPKTIPEWLKLLKTMTGFFSLLLLGGGILCFIGYALKKEVENLYLGIVLVAVVILTGVFTYYQEKKSDDLMDSFKSMLPNRCTVVRDGKPVEVNAEFLTGEPFGRICERSWPTPPRRFINCTCSSSIRIIAPYESACPSNPITKQLESEAI